MKYEHIAKLITELRFTLKLSRNEFKDKLGISLSSLSHYENGRRRPNVPAIRSFLKAAEEANIALEFKDFYHK